MKDESITPDKSKTAQIAKIVYNPIDPVNEKILKIVYEKNEVSIQDLAIEIGLHPSSISRRVNLLQSEGLVVNYKKRKNYKGFVKWVGGLLSIESELENATKKHVKASLLAENIDLMILDPFSPFSLLFEDPCWELIMNFKGGLTDVELLQRIGASVSLDSVRRVLVICDNHKIIKIRTIRDPASGDIVKIFDPLYRIDSVNKQYLDFLILIRGLASAMSFRIEGKGSEDGKHMYEPILDMILNAFYSLENQINVTNNPNDKELLNKLITNYDFASSFDRVYHQNNWRKLLQNSNLLFLDKKGEFVLLRNSFINEYQKNIKKGS